MTQILDLSGKTISHVPASTKKAHDSEEAKRERARLQTIFQNLMQQFVKDISQPDDFPPVMEVDLNSVMEHYDAKWREQCRVTNESSKPLRADPETMLLEMRRITENERLQRLARTPLCQLPDMAEYHLLPLRHIARGLLHINSRAAVAIDTQGNTTVWLRGPNERVEDWCSGWAPEPWRDPVVEAPNYTLGELNNLLAITRRPDVSALNEDLMDAARTPAPSIRKPWYRFW
jgi:hypothetical protein